MTLPARATTSTVRPALVMDAIARFKKHAASLYFPDDPDLTSPNPAVLVASNVDAAQARKLLASLVAQNATMVYYIANGDVYVIKVSARPGNKALNGVLRATQPYVQAHAAFIDGVSQQDMTVFGVPAFAAKPDYIIMPRTRPAGQPDANPGEDLATPRVVIEIEYHHRSLSVLLPWATDLLSDPLIRAVVGILVYNRYQNGTFALLAVLFRRNAAGAVAVDDLVSFGTRAIHTQIMPVIAGLPAAPGVALRVLPLPPISAPHISFGPTPAVWAGLNPSITVPGADVFYLAPAPAVAPLPDLIIDLWPILDEVASYYNR